MYMYKEREDLNYLWSETILVCSDNEQFTEM